MSGDYGYGPSIGFLRFCDDPELACCRAEKDYLRLKAQEIDLYEKAMELECELTLLRKVASIAWNVVETRGMSDVLLNELAGRLADWETWKEGER